MHFEFNQNVCNVISHQCMSFSATETIIGGNREKKGALCVHSFAVGSLRLLFSCLSLPPVMTSHFGLIRDLS